MLFENVMAILNKCRNENLNDVLVAEDMLVAENSDKTDEIRKAGDFLNKYYFQITKCNRLGLTDKIKEICEAKDDDTKLKALFDEIAEIEE
jgi:hypothetical protein